MKLSFLAGTTSKIIQVFIRDLTKFDDNPGYIGLTSSTSGLYCRYWREGSSTSNQISLISGTLGTWSAGSFTEMSSGEWPGWYELGIPNAVLEAGAKSVRLRLYGATNMQPCPVEIELQAVDNQDATAFGLSRLDATISSRMATFTLPTNFSSLSIDSSGLVNLGKVLNVSINPLISGRIDANAQVVEDKTGYALTSAEHVLIQTDVVSGLVSQGWTPVRASYLDNIPNIYIDTQAIRLFNTAVSGAIVSAINTNTTNVGNTIISNLQGFITTTELAVSGAIVNSINSFNATLSYAVTGAIVGNLSGYINLVNNAVSGAIINNINTNTNGVSGYIINSINTNTNSITGIIINNVNSFTNSLIYAASGAIVTNINSYSTFLSYAITGAIIANIPTGSSISSGTIVSSVRTAIGSGVNINLDQNVAHTQSADTIGRALQIARAQGRGNWDINTSGNTLTLYDTDGSTVVAVFNLTPLGGPYTTRTTTNE